MANHTGQSGTVKLGSDAVGSVSGFSLDTTGDVIENSNLGSTARQYLAGRTSWSASVECHFDETDSNGQQALTVGSSVALNLYPEGADSGDYYFSGTWLIGSNSISIPTDGIIEASFNATLTGALTRGTV